MPLLTALLLLPACGDTAPRDGGRIALERCHVQGVEVETLCGTLQVYEDREAGAGRQIPLRVVRVPAVSPEPEPDPLFFLAGGPGQAASEVMAAVMPSFGRIHKDRDIVFVDQRGTGGSNPLDCPEEGEGSLSAQLGGDEMDPEGLRRCLDALDADPTKYITTLAMDDLDEVRAALGYERINLYGASYGTRAALVYMRRHPDRVRAAILDGVAPPDMELFLHFARDGQEALDALLRDCAEDPACGEAFPDLEGALYALLEALEEPETITVRHPLTGRPEEVAISRVAFAANLRGLLYSPQISSLLPLAIDRARAGEFEPFVAQAQGLSGGVSEGISLGMMLSVVCAEDLPRITPAMREDAARGTFMGDALVAMMTDACAVWPAAQVPEGYSEPVSSEVPVLVLSGALDPVTPPRWGAHVLRTLPEGVHAIAPGAGHNVAPLGCAPQKMAEFISTAEARSVDLSCIQDIQRPEFFVDFAGPAE